MDDGVASEPAPSNISRLLLCKGRTGRLGYFLGLIVVIVCVIAALAFFAAVMNPTGGGAPGLAIPMILIALWLHVCICVARLRDAGISPWWSVLLVLGPFALVALLVEYLEVLEGAWVLLGVGLFVCYAGPIFLRTRTSEP